VLELFNTIRKQRMVLRKIALRPF